MIFNFMTAAAVALVGAGCGGRQSYDLDGGDLVTVGERFVDQRACANCHQSENAADGTLSGQTTPRPNTTAYGGNLTPDHATGIGDWADIEIVRAMRYGFDPEGDALCPPMPHYDGIDPMQPAMTDLEASAIVAYLRSLPSVARQIPASTCPPIKPQPLPDLAMPPAPDLATPADGGAG